MAEPSSDDIERRAAADGPRSRGVALADESPDELPALLAIAVGVAVLAIAIVWPSISDRTTVAGSGDGAAAVEAADDHGDEGDGDGDGAAGQDEPGDGEGDGEGDGDGDAAAALPDLPAIEAALAAAGLDGIDLGADGRVLTATGVVPDEATRDQVLALLAGQPDVDEVVDALTIEAPAPAGPDVTVTAAQVSLVLEGTVPSEEIAQAIVDRAVEVYSEEQVDNRLQVDPSVEPPATLTITGSMTDEVLFGQVTAAFDDLDGVEVGDLAITLEESSEVESSLNSLEPIQFASGSALVEPASEPILDEAAQFLQDNPDVAIEIGGHTDSTGGEEANQALSQARAESVLEALRARGVTNELTAVGFGERRLRVNPDENDPEAQRINRRIEFRIVN